MDLSLKAMDKMNQWAKESGIRFFVILIPTKESVFQKLHGIKSGNYQRLIQNEEKFQKVSELFFKNKKIEFINALPALQLQLEQGRQPYLNSFDGHPNVSGHLVIAELINHYLKHQ